MEKIFMRFPNGRRKAVTFSYDDGVEQDEKLIQIFKDYGLKATFNLNSGCFVEEGHIFPADWIGRRVTVKKALELYTNSGMEVAIHTLNHPSLIDVAPREARREVKNDRINLEEMFNRIVRGMAYPFGTYNDHILKMLKEEGVVYARTCESTHDFYMPTNWLALPTTCHHSDPLLMALAHKLINACEDGECMMMYVWGHSYEFDRDDNWFVIEDFSKYISNRDDIWYATNLEIYEYQDDFNRLIFSANKKIVKNPTSRSLYFRYNSQNYEIKSGESLALE